MATSNREPQPDLDSVELLIEEKVSGKRLGRPPRPPRYEPGDQPEGTQWTVLRTLGDDGLPLVSFPTPKQVAQGIRGSRVVECVCSCGEPGVVYEIHLFYRHSTRCKRCASGRKGLTRSTGKTRQKLVRRSEQPVVTLEELERAEAEKKLEEIRQEARLRVRRERAEAQAAEMQALQQMVEKQRKSAADAIRLSEHARVLVLRRSGLL